MHLVKICVRRGLMGKDIWAWAVGIPSSVSCSVAFLIASLSAISSASGSAGVSGAKGCVLSWSVMPSRISSRSSDEAPFSLPMTASRVATLDSSAAMYSRDTGGRLKSSSRNSHRTFAAEQLEQGSVLVHFIYTWECFSLCLQSYECIEEGLNGSGVAPFASGIACILSKPVNE